MSAASLATETKCFSGELYLKKGLIAVIRLYQYGISPWLGNHCRFYPSCSRYAEGAIVRFGLLKGVFLSVLRCSRCHPWHAGGEDPVPQVRSKA